MQVDGRQLGWIVFSGVAWLGLGLLYSGQCRNHRRCDYRFQCRTGYVPQDSTTAGHPVNMVNGNMYHVERDITIKGCGGLPFVFELSYRNRDKKISPLGFGWTQSFHHYLIFNDDNADGIANSEDSNKQTLRQVGSMVQEAKNILRSMATRVVCRTVVLFLRRKAFSLLRPAMAHTRLQRRTGLQTRSKTLPATSARKRNSQVSKIATAIRSHSPKLMGFSSTVTDGLARPLTFFYDGSSRITEVRDWTGKRHQYGYDILAVRGESRC